jgi:hypothetical protein
MNPSFIVPLAVTLASQPGSLPAQAIDLGAVGGLDAAALAPLLLGAVLWGVLLIAIRVVREQRRQPTGPTPLSPASASGMPAAA